MLVNPLFDQDEHEDKKPAPKDEGHAFVHRKGKTIQPISKDLRAETHARPPERPAGLAKGSEQAIELIRSKVAALYNDEPDIKEELSQVVEPIKPLSKHQQFMQKLSTSGRSLAEIQTEWHKYYAGLSDTEKHEVWREFYDTNARQPSAYTQHVNQQAVVAAAANTDTVVHNALRVSVGAPKAVVAEHLPTVDFPARRERRTKSQIKKQIRDRVQLSAETSKKAKQHFQSLAFGLGMGFLVLVIFLFGFFNEMFIAPFIQPSRNASATPIIVTADSVSASPTPEVIIPKINVQIPVVYNLNSTAEDIIQKGLEDGVIHYSSTVLPGQQGNVAIFGHSSNNLFNKGKYKFAFVKLHELVPGDVFHLSYDKKVYAYRVYDKKVVAPSEVSVLDNVPGKAATATLITCDPPGTSTNRLVVWGEQVSPDPAGATAPTPAAEATTPVTLPSEGPTLWKRFWSWVF